MRRLLAALSIGLLLFVTYRTVASDLIILPISLFLTGGVIACMYRLTRRYCHTPPIGWTNFGEITMRLVGVKAATKMTHLRTHADILDELRPLLVNVLSVEASRIVPSARLIEDLGMN